MTRPCCLLALGLSLFVSSASPLSDAQQAAADSPKSVAIRAGRLIDGKNDNAVPNVLILIEGGKIANVTPGGSPPPGVQLIDLSQATVLPGFADAHTHILLQGDITDLDYDAQLLKQSIPYRAILAARNAQIALSHGFTALRDLETEGAMYADADVKKAINNGEIPGPHMQVATRAMAPTGMYPLLGYSWELKVPTGVQYVDGVEEGRKAVREQVMHGADWIKYYSDHGSTAQTASCTVTLISPTRKPKPSSTRPIASAKKLRRTPLAMTASQPHLKPARTPSNTATALASHKWRRWFAVESSGFPRLWSAPTSRRAARATGQKWSRPKRPRSNWP